MAIHCHSARYHYDSFHSRGGDIINIGSNNTYNIGGYGAFGSIWGNGGSFWSGFGTSLGWGLGQGLMGWLGNGLSGGGWNPAGIFGGGMGFCNSMGFGMNPWSSFGWGGSTGRGGSASGTTDSSSHKDCVDSDRQLINQLGSKVINLQDKPNATREDAVKLYKEIAKAKKDTNDIHKATDQKDYDNWMNVLNNYAKSKSWGDLNSTDAPTLPAPTTQKTPATPSSPSTPATPTATQSDGAGKTGTQGAGGATQTGQTDDSNMPWSSINNWENENPLVETDIRLPQGYTAITTSEQVTSLKLAHDTSDKQKDKDVVAGDNGAKVSTVLKTEQGKVSVPEYVSLTTAKNNTYNYKCIGYSKQGYPVYTTPKQGSESKGHIYILVKQGNDFVLLQCSNSFTGWNIADRQV